MLSSKFCHLRRLVFDQSFLVHPVSESMGGDGELDGWTDKIGGGGRKFRCLILDEKSEYQLS